MKKYLILAICFLFAYSIYGQDTVFKYIGAANCATCHKTEKQGEQERIWKESMHSKAYETLKSDQAKEIAEKLGLEKAPNEADECLSCHVAGHGLDAAMFDKKFKMEDGVQCESCHGPGSEYKSIKVMKSREESIKNGLAPILAADGTAEESCKTCHNENSPTYKEFNFTEAWEKIKHPKP